MMRLGGLLINCWLSREVQWVAGLAVETLRQWCEVGVGEMRAGIGHSAIVVMLLGTTVWGCCITPVVKPTAIR